MDAGVSVERRGADHDHAAAPRSYQPRDRFTIATTESITGTSTSTPTTVASAAPDFRPNSDIAAATASSKKFDAPISAAGAATHPATPNRRPRERKSTSM